MAPPHFSRSGQPWMTDYAHHFTTYPTGFSDLPMAMQALTLNDGPVGGRQFLIAPYPMYFIE